MAPGYGLPKVLRFYEQLSSINKKLEAAYQKLKQKWCSSRRFFQYKVDAEPIETCPSVDTVMLALLLLLLYFFALAVVALVIPNDHVKWTVIGVGTAFVILLSIVFGTDVYGKTVRKQERKYSRNLANTVLTVLFTTFVLTAMYGVFWHDKLNEVIIRRNEDVVVSCRLPLVEIGGLRLGSLNQNSQQLPFSSGGNTAKPTLSSVS